MEKEKEKEDDSERVVLGTSFLQPSQKIILLRTQDVKNAASPNSVGNHCLRGNFGPQSCRQSAINR